MIWNALQAYEVEYKTTLVTDSKGQLTSQITVQDKVDGNFKKITLLKDKYEADKEDAGVLMGCTKVSGKDYYTITTSAGDKTYNKISADVSDMIGMKVQVLHKDTATEEVVYGVYPDEDSKLIATGTVGQLENMTDSKKTKLDGTEYKLDKEPENITVITPNQKNESIKLSGLEGKTSLAYVAATVKLIDTDGNNKADSVVYVPTKVGQITYAGSKSVTINNGVGSNDIDELDIYKDYAKDDWVAVVSDDYTASTNTAVTKIDVTSAKVSSIKSSNPKEVKINDTWYKVATTGDSITVADDTASIKSGSTYDFAIVGNYVVNAKETEASSNDILMLADYDTTSGGFTGSASTQQVKVYFLDGTSKTITVEKFSDDSSKDAQDIKSGNMIEGNDLNKLYTYSTRSNGNYSLKLLGEQNKAGYDTASTYASGNIDDNQKISGKAVNDDAVIFVAYGDVTGSQAKDKVKILTGKTVNDWKNAYGSYVQYASKKSNGIETVRVAVIVASDNYSGAGSNYKYAYMTSNSYEGTNGEDNDKTTVYEAWNGTENVTLKYDGSDGTPKAAGDVLIYTNDGADFINVEKATDVDIYKVAITGIEKKKEGTVAVQGFKVSDNSALKNQSFDMDEDCVYIAVNDDKQEGKTGSSLDQIALAEETSTKGNYYLNAYIVVEKTGDRNILAIVYDADNNRLDQDIVVDNTGNKVTAATTYVATGKSTTDGKITVSPAKELKAGDLVTFTFANTNDAPFESTGKVEVNVTGTDATGGKLSINYTAGKTTATATAKVTGNIEVTNFTVVPNH
jgi:ribosomal 50S subunit-recycling heat shock protein